MTNGEGSEAGSGGEWRESLTAADVAELTEGRLIGDPSVHVRGIAPLDRATEADLSLLSHRRYLGWFIKSNAGIVVVAPEFESTPGHPATRVVVERPTVAIIPVLAKFYRAPAKSAGVHDRAVVSSLASIGEDVTIGACAVIGDGVVIGDRSTIGANSSVGAGAIVGKDVTIDPSVVIYPMVEVGDRVVIHSGASIGSDGFGFVPGTAGSTRIPHVGRCILEDDVEIGCNSCVDRGSIDDTIIGAGTKVDNLVHIAHNVRIGRMCFIAAQTGIAGSARLEDGVQVGGQAGLGGHLTVGKRATIGGQAGVFGDVPAGETWSGYPARPHREELRRTAALHRLAKIVRPLEALLSSKGDK